MLLKFIGEDGSMGLKKDTVYRVKISANFDRIWVHVDGKTKVINCPYNSIKALLNNWEEI